MRDNPRIDRVGAPAMKVTIRDVARVADVSVATVSRAFNRADTVSAETREHVLRVAGALDFVPHAGARSLSLSRYDTIGVILPDLHGEYFSELIRGIDLGARSCEQHLLLSASHGDVAEAVSALRTMRSRVDGLVVLSPFAHEDLTATAAKSGTPLVLLNNHAGSLENVSFAIDNHAGALAVTRHLIEAGHRRIAFVSGPHENLEAAERLRGYHDAHAEAGLSPQPVLPGDFCEASGFEAAGILLQSGLPDAIFAANDAMAIGCLRALRGAGVVVPNDVALAGFDDIPIARLIDPPLTTAGVSIAEIGRQAVVCCVDLVRGRPVTPGTRLFAPKLVIRASSGANKKRSAETAGPTGRK